MGREREREKENRMDKKGERRYRVWKRQMERMVEVREENCEDCTRVTATRPAKVAITHEGRKKREEQ